MINMIKHKLRVLSLFENVEKILGIYRNFSNYESVCLKLLIILFIFSLYSSILIVGVIIYQEVGVNKIADFYIKSPFFLTSISETIFIHFLSIWHSKKYIKIKQKLESVTNIVNKNILNSKNNINNNIYLLVWYILLILIILEIIIVSRALNSVAVGITFSLIYYFSLIVHFLQMLTCSMLCNIIADVISYCIFFITSSKYKKQGVNELRIVYRDLITCTDFFIESTGMQVTFLLISLFYYFKAH